MNGLSLAYLGDAYFELEVRKYLLNLGITKINSLHKEKVKFASNVSQAKIMEYLLASDVLNTDEIDAYKKGRNAAHFSRKNLDMVTYQQATGFESLIGYLSLNDEVRCKVIIGLAMEFIKQGDGDGQRPTK